MIPASPSVMAPPVKKQRAGNTPEDPISAVTESAINYRSERLQDLAQRYGTATRVQYPLSKQNGNCPPSGPSLVNSSVAPPQSRRPGESMRGGGRPVPTGLHTYGNGPATMRGPPPGASNFHRSTGGPPVFEAQQKETNSRQAVPPPKPEMATMQPRRSDIFPSVPKQSPISSKPSSSFITAAALKAPQPQLYGNDGAVARRLEDSFHAKSPDLSRSKSAPPTRPPPPPGPPPLVKEEPAKVVSFQVPPSSTIISPPIRSNVTSIQQSGSIQYNGKAPENTATPDDTAISIKDAGATPFYSVLPPGETPFRSNAVEELPTPPTAARRDLLRNMREFAESPDKPMLSPSESGGNVKSPELRLHEQLASSEKEKALALRKVAHLEEEIAQMKSLESNVSNQKNVGFKSPVANSLPSPNDNRNRRKGTPHPKSNLPKPSTPTEIDEVLRCLMEAAKMAPFEYDTEDGMTFIVRRPYGLAKETDLWYKVGQLPVKLYSKSANVEFFSSVEVAAAISCDDSIFILFGEGDVRHHSNVTGMSTDYRNVEERSTILGSITYVDKNAIDKEYSLDELYEFALSVRGHYCTTVRSFAAALQLHPEPITTASVPPPTTEVVKTEVKPTVVETADKAIATDDEVLNKSMKETRVGTEKSKPPPPLPDDDTTTDVLATFIHLFFSVIFGTIWFIFVKVPIRIFTATIVTAIYILLLSYIWLFLVVDPAANVRIYSNRPGIM
jgi:hypothetical protein